MVSSFFVFYLDVFRGVACRSELLKVNPFWGDEPIAVCSVEGYEVKPYRVRPPRTSVSGSPPYVRSVGCASALNDSESEAGTSILSDLERLMRSTL